MKRNDPGAPRRFERWDCVRVTMTNDYGSITSGHRNVEKAAAQAHKWRELFPSSKVTVELE